MDGHSRTSEGSGELAPTPSSAEIVRGPLAPDDLEWVNDRLLQAQKMEVLGRLAAGVAHDFNNLLTVIIGVADLRGGMLSPGDPVRGDFEEIRGAGERAARLTRQLLNFVRSSRVEPAVIDAVAHIRETERMLRRLIGEDVVLVTRLEAPQPYVFLDPMQLDVVLMNLVINARDAMPSGGRLVIECTNRGDTHGSWLQIRVQDSGVGMSAEVKKRLFQPFFTTKEPGRGTGLGLTACHGIVTSAGGTIRVESEPGQGTAFTVEFPSSEQRAPEAEPRDGAGLDSWGSGETVLLVEDDPNVRNVCEEGLRQNGYRVLVAGDSNEALSVAGRAGSPIRILVADLVMQGMGGRTLFERLKAGRPGLRALFISGYNDDALSREASGLQEEQLLRKPFSPGTLARRVRTALEEP